ncbi:unnamed protein product [Rhizoctonia solani]|uniref:Uncharacterized protein n=1 Tax=Rhizoctonia solani TaxID=456999 RepID=A0A8H2WK32_9AGAM|nr:unnamed protein product [Rhizoctonia solani]
MPTICLDTRDRLNRRLWAPSTRYLSSIEHIYMCIHPIITNTKAGDDQKIDALVENLEDLKVDNAPTKKEQNDESDSSCSSSGGPQLSRGSTRHTSPDAIGLLRSRSPTSNSRSLEISWEAAQVLLHNCVYFWHYEGPLRQLYCWCIQYAPMAMGIEAESQMWRMASNYSPARPTGLPHFQLTHRLPHSGFTGGFGSVANYRLMLPSHNVLRGLSRLPEDVPVLLHEDVESAYEEPDLSFMHLTREQDIYGFSVQGPTNHGLVMAPILPPGLIDNRFNRHPSRGQELSSSRTFEFQGLPVNPQQAPATAESSPDEVEMWMDVGDTTPTDEQVKDFTNTFRRNGPGKGASVIICLHCPSDSEKRIMPDLRPWHLKRHLMSHFRRGN